MILVTGGTGFLGHSLVPYLQEAGFKVRALVRPTSQVDYLKSRQVELIYSNDITDRDALDYATKGCRYVIHAAGHFRFWGDFNQFWQTNVIGTENVVAAAYKNKVERMIHISSIAIVGTPPQGSAIDETTECNPQDHYQITKLEAERRLKNFQQKTGFPVVILRPGAYYGPWGRYAFNRLFFEEPLRGWRIKVAHGNQITFPVFVPDVAKAILLALTKGDSGETYNICGECLTHNQINQIVSDIAQIAPWRINVPTSLMIQVAKSWTKISQITNREPFYPINLAGYVFQDWLASSAKAKELLGFDPITFSNGVQETLDWYWKTGVLQK